MRLFQNPCAAFQKQAIRSTPKSDTGYGHHYDDYLCISLPIVIRLKGSLSEAEGRETNWPTPSSKFMREQWQGYYQATVETYGNGVMICVYCINDSPYFLGITQSPKIYPKCASAACQTQQRKFQPIELIRLIHVDTDDKFGSRDSAPHATKKAKAAEGSSVKQCSCSRRRNFLWHSRAQSQAVEDTAGKALLNRCCTLQVPLKPSRCSD